MLEIGLTQGVGRKTWAEKKSKQAHLRGACQLASSINDLQFFFSSSSCCVLQNQELHNFFSTHGAGYEPQPPTLPSFFAVNPGFTAPNPQKHSGSEPHRQQQPACLASRFPAPDR